MRGWYVAIAIAGGCGHVEFDRMPDATGSPSATRVLFIRGGPGTAGFMPSDDDQYAADITDATTSNGWGVLAQRLAATGATVEQRIEGPETARAPADLSGLDAFTVIVFGSNNATYTTADADAVEAWVRAGGAALFISDQAFGNESLEEPADSDQTFLDRFDLVMNQDTPGQVTRTSDQWLVPGHPVLAGVSSFNAAGVSPISVVDNIADVTPLILVAQLGTVHRNDAADGTTTPATASDAAIVVANVGFGRVAAFFDRDILTNPSSANPCNLSTTDNGVLIANLFEWLANGD